MNGRKKFAARMLVGFGVVCLLTWALADYWPLNVETPFNGYRKLRGFSIGEELAFIPQVIAVLVLGIGGLAASIFVPAMFINQFVRGREKYHQNGYYNKAVALLAPLAFLWASSFVMEVYLNGVNVTRVPLLIVAAASVFVTFVGVISNFINPKAKWFSKWSTTADSPS